MAASECLVGLLTQNVHILRDFLLTSLMLASLLFSYKCLEMSVLPRDIKYSLGYSRMNLLAAFCNCTYMQCMVLFALLETFHNVIE